MQSSESSEFSKHITIAVGERGYIVPEGMDFNSLLSAAREIDERFGIDEDTALSVVMFVWDALSKAGLANPRSPWPTPEDAARLV